MITTHPGRAAALGLLVSLALGVQARASDFFHRLCHPKKCAETERVILPQQQVEVVRERPSVIVREVAPTRVKRSAEVGVVPIQTVYMPLAMPLVPAVTAVPTGASRDICETRDLEYNPLEAVHRAELAAFRSDQAKRELEVTVEAHQRALQRFAGPTRSLAPEPASRGVNDAAIEQRLNQLSDEIQKLNNRVTAVEKLLIYHDNLIMQNGGRSAVPLGPGIPPAGSGLPMVPPIRDVPSRAADIPSLPDPGKAPPMLPPPTPVKP